MRGHGVFCYTGAMRKRGILNPRKHYLQVALNGTLHDAESIISILPPDPRIIIEAGTPLIKNYGMHGIRRIRDLWEQRLASTNELSPELMIYNKALGIGNTLVPLLGGLSGMATPGRGHSVTTYGENRPYIVADMKTMDRGATEVRMAADAGASAIIALGSAPTETLNAFIAACRAREIDSMIDMMNVEYPISVLTALKEPSTVVILHRGVDEERDNRQKMLPLHEIRRIKGRFDILIAVAGGDTSRDVQSAAFNDADIIVVWKSVYEKTSDTQSLVQEFLKTIK